MEQLLTIHTSGIANMQLISQVLDDAFERADESLLTAELLADIDATVKEYSLLVADEQNPIAYALLSRLYVPGEPEAKFWALAPVGVKSSHQNMGIGTGLVFELLERAQANGETGVFVLGDPDFYDRFGFIPADTWGYECPFDAPSEAFRMALLQNYDPQGGTIIYPEPFHRL